MGVSFILISIVGKGDLHTPWSQYLFVPFNINCCDTTAIEQDTFSLPKIFQSNHSRTYIPILINNQLITLGQLRMQNLTGGKAGE